MATDEAVVDPETEPQTEEAQEPQEEQSAYTKAEQRHYAEIVDQNKRVAVAEGDFEDANAEAKRLKKVFEAETTKLRSLIRSGPSDSQPTFPGMEDADKPASDAWRDLPLSAAGIKGALAKALEKQEFKTLGQVADYLNAGNNIDDITGVGSTKAEDYADLMEAFWGEHPEYCGEGEKAETDPEEEGDDGE